MMKFISGAVVGAAAASLGFYLAGTESPAPVPAASDSSVPAAADRPAPEQEDRLKHAYLWLPLGGSGRLQRDQAPDSLDNPKYQPVPPADYPVITLKSETLLGSASRNDVRRVCVGPFPKGSDTPGEINTEMMGLYVNVWLTDEARTRIGAQALTPEGADGADGMFLIDGVPVARFSTDAKQVNDYVASAEEPAFDTDFSFYALVDNAYTALHLAKRLTGENRIEPCEEGLDLDTVPGYTANLKAWDDMVANFPKMIEEAKALQKAQEAEKAARGEAQ